MSKKQINYQALFYMGITFIGTGIVFIASVNLALGIAFISIGIANIVVGLKHKDTWKN